jgi:CHAT domain-containing protein
MLGAQASRRALVELAPRARFLHLATHGYFAPESIPSVADPRPIDAKLGILEFTTSEEQVRGLSPMLLCGLAFAGANLPPDRTGRLAGTLTAEELAALDLSGCELAVLSACDTNVGLQRDGMGLASLQRALHMAGARTALTSLWKVPDEATRELMVDFYRRIWKGKEPKAQALWEAKQRLAGMRDSRGRPQYAVRDWAGWVLTGDAR